MSSMVSPFSLTLMPKKSVIVPSTVSFSPTLHKSVMTLSVRDLLVPNRRVSSV